MEADKIREEIKVLVQQRDQAMMMFHQATGAIAVYERFLADINKTNEETPHEEG